MRKKHKQCQLGRKIEVIPLRAQDEQKKDYKRSDEMETWCRLHEELPSRYGLRFLVRKIEGTVVTVGGIRITERLVIYNGSKVLIPDKGVSADERKKEVRVRWANTLDGRGLLVIDQFRAPGAKRFRAQIELKKGDCFELQFAYGRGFWGGNVKLADIRKRAGAAYEPAHLIALFEVRFFDLLERAAEETY